jgi:hypothetical protein
LSSLLMIKLFCAFFFQALLLLLLLLSLMSKNHIVLCAKLCSCSVFFFFAIEVCQTSLTLFWW